MAEIECERLLLRPWRMQDQAAVAAILGDAQVMEFSDTGALDPSAQAGWLQRAINSAARSDPGLLAIERKVDHVVIGYIGLSYNPARVQAAELGFRLIRAAWGRGYASEALAALIARFGDRRIVAIVDPHNQRSVHVLQKRGMRRDGEIMFEGYDHPDHVYVLDGV